MGREYRVKGGEPARPPQEPKSEGFRLREGQGTLFHNKHKKEGDNRPALVGKLLIEGKEYEVAIWKKKGRSGVVFYSMDATLPDQTDAERPQNTPAYEDESQEPEHEDTVGDHDASEGIDHFAAPEPKKYADIPEF